jgi:hypothetical protein
MIKLGEFNTLVGSLKETAVGGGQQDYMISLILSYYKWMN